MIKATLNEREGRVVKHKTLESLPLMQNYVFLNTNIAVIHVFFLELYDILATIFE